MFETTTFGSNVHTEKQAHSEDGKRNGRAVRQASGGLQGSAPASPRGALHIPRVVDGISRTRLGCRHRQWPSRSCHLQALQEGDRNERSRGAAQVCREEAQRHIRRNANNPFSRGSHSHRRTRRLRGLDPDSGGLALVRLVEKFYENAKHVLRKPGGVIAATVYRTQPKVDSPQLARALDGFWASIGRHWSPQIFEYVETGNKNLPFPFKPVVQESGAPNSEATMDARLEEFVNYLKSLSAVQTASERGEEPLGEQQMKVFADAWGPPETLHCLRWALEMLLGTV